MRWSAVVAGAALVLPERAYADEAVRPVNLELVTLTETGAILTWYTGVAGTDARPARPRPDTPYHYVELTGLEPGRTHYYQARSRGRAADAATAF